MFTKTKIKLKRSLIVIFTIVSLFMPSVSSAFLEVTTLAATGVTASSATLNGVMFNPNSQGELAAYFKYSATPTNSCANMASTPIPVPNLEPSGALAPEYDFSYTIGGLSPSTQYYFCALGTEGSGGFVYGSVLVFTTPAVLGGSGSGYTGPVGECGGQIDVFTGDAIGISDTKATMTGTVSCGIGYFRYTTAITPPVFCNEIFGSNMISTRDLGSGAVAATVIGLKPDTTYYYCLIASDREIISYEPTDEPAGRVRSFHTKPCQECAQTYVNTLQAIILSPYSASLRGEYGSSVPVELYFEYKEDTGGSWIQTAPEGRAGNTYGKFNFVVGDLQADTEYNFRAMGVTEDPAATYEGTVLNFKTIPADGGLGGTGGWTFQNNDTTPGGGIFGGPNEPPDPVCPAGWSGTPPDCTPPPVACPDGWEGDFFPNCTPPPTACPAGWTGDFFPNCTPPPTACPAGWSGDFYPNCTPPAGENECPTGWSGTPPNCTPPAQECPADWVGDFYPNCAPPTSACPADWVGDFYPNCAPPTSACPANWTGDFFPNCTPPPVACPAGWTGSFWPNCTSSTGNFGPDDNFGSNPNDIDNDGIPNNIDPDIDGDGLPNHIDTDDDNDGIPDGSDITPMGPGSSNDDVDWDGIPNDLDPDDDGDGIPDAIDPTPLGPGTVINDLDGDGELNVFDSDTDGDGIPNSADPDDDNDGIPDSEDYSPQGHGSISFRVFDRDNQFFDGTNNNLGNNFGTDSRTRLRLGQIVDPPVDAIVRYHEGVEHVLYRQIKANSSLQQRYGYESGENLDDFAWTLAHLFGIDFGYVNNRTLREIRVKKPDVAAYELRDYGDELIIYEYYEGKITGIRDLSVGFKSKFYYEYYFTKKRQ